MNYAKMVASGLLERGAVKVQVDPLFTWASGIKSPVYCDNRKMIGFVEERKLIVEGFKDLIARKNLEFDVIAGTATAGIPWAAFLAYEVGAPMVYVRPEKKLHGAGRQVEGFVEEGSRVLLVEDLVSTGGSSLKALEALRGEVKAVVDDVVAIVSWGLDGTAERFSEAGVKFDHLVGFDDLIDGALERGDITSADREAVLKFRESPRTWADSL
ncbi:orotate phosphoribosyltransferase [Candidatus Peregrinibacteria bacterium HGW-Peregrinibacteria-1]|jgi:orotate phosphoribosyltransferase|nr:MAG: orotate phosphoribosyltransferase [Candidatus Peregrinibacteria bacterium HGW-Peregrinibacteria-1]